MASYLTLTSARATLPDAVALAAAVKSATGDATAVLVANFDGTWRGKKAAPWSAAEIVAVQALLDTTPPLTPQLAAQRTIDSFPIEYRALVLALIDETNRLRAALRGLGVPGLPDVAPAQAIASIRTKAGTL